LLGVVLPLLFSFLACSEPEQSNVPSEDAATNSSEAPPLEIIDQSLWPERIAARHILIPFVGATGAPLNTEYSKEEALEAALSIREALENGADMSALARLHSTDSTASRGGFLGGANQGVWAESFERVAFNLEVGAISSPVETSYGFHIIKRELLEEVKLLHIVIQHAESTSQWEDTPNATRSVDEARELAESTAERIHGGDDFQEVAAELSDGPTGIRGADLGWFIRGEISALFDEAVFSLEVGDTTEPIETPWGFHLVKRVE